MKCITVQQPYASLIVTAKKKFETRYWPTEHRGLLAIHAARLPAKVESEILRALPTALENLPTGAIVGTVELIACRPSADYRLHIEDPERKIGFWSSRTYAWQLANPRELQQPIHISGMPGIWEIDDALVLPYL